MTLARTIFSLLVLCTVVAHAVGDTITLRPAATIAPGSPVLVSDIAHVQGDEGVGNVVVLDAPAAAQRAGKDGTLSLTLAEVRRALASNKSINMGRMALSGSTVAVRIGAETAPTAAQPRLATDHPGDTLGSVLSDALARWFAVATDAIQIDTTGVDPKVLATPLTGRTYAVSTGTRGAVLPVQVRVFEGDTPVLTQTIRVGVKLKKAGCVATRDIQRGQALSADDLRTEEVWVTTSSTPETAENATGGIAQSTIKAGEVIEDRQVASPPTIKRGDMVSVDCLSGAVMLRTTMRAKQDGRVGEVIWLEPLTKTAPKRPLKKDQGDSVAAGAGPVRARIAGAGRAVTVVQDETEGATP